MLELLLLLGHGISTGSGSSIGSATGSDAATAMPVQSPESCGFLVCALGAESVALCSALFACTSLGARWLIFLLRVAADFLECMPSNKSFRSRQDMLIHLPDPPAASTAARYLSGGSRLRRRFASREALHWLLLLSLRETLRDLLPVVLSPVSFSVAAIGGGGGEAASTAVPTATGAPESSKASM